MLFNNNSMSTKTQKSNQYRWITLTVETIFDIHSLQNIQRSIRALWLPPLN